LTDIAAFDIVTGWPIYHRICFLKDGNTMDVSLYELVLKILWGVSFIAIGGAAALMFFLIFAQSILGSKTIHSQLEMLLRQNEQINDNLRRIIRLLEEDKENHSPKI
jgi:hypothetical protein